jgi:SAM-dependent methyltransferase
LTSFEQRDAALDVGGLVSSMVNALSRHFGVVHHVESSPLLAEFAAKRFAQDRLDNVTVSRASASRLPFGDDAFDSVTLHGTMARLAKETGPSAAPPILAECRRVLRPGGRVYLSFDNPVWYGGFAARAGRRDLERTIVPSALLAGFRDVSRFYAFPSFDRPRAIVPGTRRAFSARETVEARGTIRRAARRAAALAGLYPVLAPSLLIIASK